MIALRVTCFILYDLELVAYTYFHMKRAAFRAESTNWENGTLKSIISNLCAWQEFDIMP